MFERKLLALGHPQPKNFNSTDENEFRSLIIWLEDQKIRHYKIEERLMLRDISKPDWVKACEVYLTDICCPYVMSDRAAVVDWILGYAVRLEYADKAEHFKSVTAQTLGQSGVSPKPQSGQSSNPLDSLDFNDPNFKAGVASLAMMLQVPPYDDHLEQLKAICMLVKEKLSKEAIEISEKQQKKAELVPLDKIELGFDTGDYIINEAAKILRLLHIRDLRELQSSINHAIVAVQTITANPKTDSRLGKVGR